MFEHSEMFFNAARLDRSLALSTAAYARLARPRLARLAELAPPGDRPFTVRPLQPDGRVDWERLFRSYMAFYRRDDEPQSMYDRAWDAFLRDDRMHARVATLCAAPHRVVGITHLLVHANTSAADVCYLQDLYAVSNP